MEDQWTSVDGVLLLWFALKLFLLFDFRRFKPSHAVVDEDIYQGDISVEETDNAVQEALPTSADQEMGNEGGISVTSTPSLSGRKTWESEEENTSPISVQHLTPPPQHQLPYDSSQQCDLHQRDQFTFHPPQPPSHRRSKSLGTKPDTLPLHLKDLLSSQANPPIDVKSFKSEENRLARGAKLIVDAIQLLLPSSDRPQAQQSLRAIAIALSPLLKPSPSSQSIHTNPIYHPSSFLGSLTPSPSPLPLRFPSED